MKCPFCGHEESRVIESRATEEGAATRRRRACQQCDARFTTYERIERVPLYVIKKDGRREPFDRNKILSGMVTACQKRPVPLARLEEAATAIESALRNRLEPEIASRAVGEMVMDALRRIDQVAYVRFASVYRQFHDIRAFKEELDDLLHESDAT